MAQELHIYENRIIMRIRIICRKLSLARRLQLSHCVTYRIECLILTLAQVLQTCKNKAMYQFDMARLLHGIILERLNLGLARFLLRLNNERIKIERPTTKRTIMRIHILKNVLKESITTI